MAVHPDAGKPVARENLTDIAELVSHGLRDTRYVGQQKRQLQRLWTGSAVNLKRLFTLAKAQKLDLYVLLDDLGPPVVGLMPAIPQKWAGSRMLPPVSVPTSKGVPCAAIKAAAPPLLPPGVRARS